jgi:MEMO1 family protein
MATSHASPFAGHWYPAAAHDLERLLDVSFAASAGRTGEFLYSGGAGYIVPHAAPTYSGTVAAAVYRTLARQQPERVVAIGFPHRGGLAGAAVADAASISTPLGEVPIDREWLARLPFPVRPEGTLCDHSVELQIPFLQHAVPHARFAPIYAGQMNPGQRRAAAEALASAWSPGTVFVASSDLTHYGPDFHYVPFPLDGRTPDAIRGLDEEALDAAASLDPGLFLQYLSRTGATVCGADPIALLLETLRQLPGPPLWQTTLDYDTSGEITADWHHSVSYGAAGYFPSDAFTLDRADCTALVDAAEASFSNLRANKESGPAPVCGGSPALDTRRGVFVSLHQHDRLLGCLGHCPGHQPLRQAVPELALSAAQDDPRFRPAAEVAGEVAIEISVLTPLRRIVDEASFVPGVHGATLDLRSHRSLLLPQVATERNWGTAGFLEALSRKAGLGPNAWHNPDARLAVFGAQVFSREALGPR